MKDLFKRLTCGMLSIVMVAALFASCADNEDDPDLVDPDAVTESEEGTPEFEEEDWDGRTFTVLQGYLEANDWSDNFIDNEEIIGEPVNDAVIDRNRAVEEKYNVEIVVRPDGHEEAKLAAKAGTVDFELIYSIGDGGMVSEGLLYDFNQIPYIDLTQDYWAPSAQPGMSLAGKMMYSYCDISMNRIAYADFIIFNKRLLDDYGLEYPYELVNTNQWTVDKLYEMIAQCGTDVDGNTIWDVNDIYGAGCEFSILHHAVNAANMDYTIQNEDGTYRLNAYTEKLVNLYNEYSNRILPEGAVCDSGWEDFTAGRDISMYSSQHEAYRVISFGEGHLTFGQTSMIYLPELVNMDDLYGVVPHPKLDPTDEYNHSIDTMAPVFTVMKQSDTDFVGMIMEYMAYESHKRVLPAFYEQTIKTKVMTDIDGRDEAMLDIVYNTIEFDWESWYLGLGDPKTSISAGSMVGEMLVSGNFASVNKKYAAACQDAMDKAYDFMLNLDVNK